MLTRIRLFNIRIRVYLNLNIRTLGVIYYFSYYLLVFLFKDCLIVNENRE
jgi:hypothetical protein